MPKYSSVASIAFTVQHDDPDGDDLTAGDIIAALLRRIADVARTDEWTEAVFPLTDTTEQ